LKNTSKLETPNL